MNAADQTSEFVALLTRESRWIYSYILTLVPNRADADEIFQETSATLWRKFEQFESGTSFRAWALRVAHFEALQYRHKQKGLPVSLGEAFYEAVERVAMPKLEKANDMLAALEECFGLLGERSQQLLRRRYQPEGSVNDIAEADGRSNWSVYRALAKIHSTLYECIQRRMEEGVAP